MELIVANIVLVLMMLGFTVYIFNNLVKKINQSAKKWFVDKLQEYNYLIEEKEKELDEINKKIIDGQKELEEIKQINNAKDNLFNNKVENVLNKMREFQNQPNNVEVPRRPDIVYDIATPQYKETSFFKTYKQLKKHFKLNAEDTIKEFCEEHKKGRTTKEYKILSEFCAKFTEKILYECSTLKPTEQYELLNSLLTDDEKKYIKIEEYDINKNQFAIRIVIEKIKERIKEIDPTIYVYTGREDLNYDYIDPRIKTNFYKNMSEGVIIHYRGKMYDYSV